MIGYLKGEVLSAENGVVILVNNGVGYEITCSGDAYRKLTASGQGEVFTYMAVREDGISLYGFSSKEEKAMFLKLISVSGVGPKMGITVLSNMNLNDLAIKIAKSDVKGLSQIKGLGKKTAERIILELREKVSADGEDLISSGETAINEEAVVLEDSDKDALIALESLGFNKKECIEAIKKAKSLGAKTIEELISLAIKNIK